MFKKTGFYRVICLLIVGIMLAGLTACGGSTSSSPAPAAKPTPAPAPAASPSPAPAPAASPAPAPAAPAASSDPWGKDPLKFGIFHRTLASEFYSAIQAGAQQAMEDHNAQHGRKDILIAYDHNRDLNREMANIEDAVVEGINVALFNPIDPVGSARCLEVLVNAKDILTINIDGESKNSDLADMILVSNNYEAGRIQMEKLCTALNGKGNIIMFLDSTNANSNIRSEGAKEELKKFPNINVLETYDGETSIEKILNVFQNFMQAYADVGIDGTWSFSDTGSTAVCAAVAGTNLAGKIIVCGLDGNPLNLDLIKDGQQYGSAAQFPYDIGYRSVMYAFDMLAGKKFDKKILIDIQWIDKNNVDDYHGKGWTRAKVN